MCEWVCVCMFELEHVFTEVDFLLMYMQSAYLIFAVVVVVVVVAVAF